MIDSKIQEKSLPKTYEEAIEYVAMSYSQERLNEPGFHFFTGMNIRNGLNLWNKESDLYKHMLEKFGLCHADDTYALITNAAKAEMEGLKYDPWVDVEKFKAHWAEYGLNPATMEKVLT